MTKSTMNNTLRTKAAVKDNKALIEGFKAFDFVLQVGVWRCGACADEMIKASHSVGYSNCALKFKKGNQTISACRCGWRKNISTKWTPNKAFHCVSCGSSLKGELDYCYNKKCAPIHTPTAHPEPDNQGPTQPTPTQGVPVAPVKICNRVDCNNPVPPGRKAVCYECQPPAKEAVSSNITM